MAGFTMPAVTYVTPTGTVDSALDHALSPIAGTTLHCSWTATGSVSFTGHFRNRSNNALIGAQGFVNNVSGNWLYSSDPGFNGSTPFGFEIDSITNNGHNITFTFSVDNGYSYSGRYVRRTGAWVWTARQVRRGGVWVFTPRYIRRAGVWTLVHR